MAEFRNPLPSDEIRAQNERSRALRRPARNADQLIIEGPGNEKGPKISAATRKGRATLPLTDKDRQDIDVIISEALNH